MAPLHIEVLHPVNKNWVGIGEVRPTDTKGSLSDNKPDGSRDIYIFGCERDDSKSIISRSGAGIDAEMGEFRAISLDSSELEVVKELGDGESFEIDLKTDKSPEKSTIRFTHKKGI